MSMLEHHEHKRPTHDFDGITENRVKAPPVYFSVLFYGLIVWGVAFCAYFLLSGWSSEEEFRQEMAAHQEQIAAQKPTEPSPAEASAAAAPAEEEPEGEQLYAENCAVCHGAAGEGGIGPALTGPEFKYGRTADAVKTSISEGRPEGMPAFGTQLSGEEIESLSRFVLGLGQ